MQATRLNTERCWSNLPGGPAWPCHACGGTHSVVGFSYSRWLIPPSRRPRQNPYQFRCLHCGNYPEDIYLGSAGPPVPPVDPRPTVLQARVGTRPEELSLWVPGGLTVLPIENPRKDFRGGMSHEDELVVPWDPRLTMIVSRTTMIVPQQHSDQHLGSGWLALEKPIEVPGKHHTLALETFRRAQVVAPAELALSFLQELQAIDWTQHEFAHSRYRRAFINRLLTHARRSFTRPEKLARDAARVFRELRRVHDAA